MLFMTYLCDSGRSFATLSILHSQEQSALKYVTVTYLNSLCGTCLSKEVCMQSITLQHAQMWQDMVRTQKI